MKHCLAIFSVTLGLTASLGAAAAQPNVELLCLDCSAARGVRFDHTCGKPTLCPSSQNNPGLGTPSPTLCINNLGTNVREAVPDHSSAESCN